MVRTVLHQVLWISPHNYPKHSWKPWAEKCYWGSISNFLTFFNLDSQNTQNEHFLLGPFFLGHPTIVGLPREHKPLKWFAVDQVTIISSSFPASSSYCREHYQLEMSLSQNVDVRTLLRFVFIPARWWQTLVSSVEGHM